MPFHILKIARRVFFSRHVYDFRCCRWGGAALRADGGGLRTDGGELRARGGKRKVESGKGEDRIMGDRIMGGKMMDSKIIFGRRGTGGGEGLLRGRS
jgi:hypothetical protein